MCAAEERKTCKNSNIVDNIIRYIYDLTRFLCSTVPPKVQLFLTKVIKPSETVEKPFAAVLISKSPLRAITLKHFACLRESKPLFSPEQNTLDNSQASKLPLLPITVNKHKRMANPRPSNHPSYITLNKKLILSSCFPLPHNKNNPLASIPDVLKSPHLFNHSIFYYTEYPT